MAKIIFNVQKRLKGVSVKADFWYGENIDHVKEKSSKVDSLKELPKLTILHFL